MVHTLYVHPNIRPLDGSDAVGDAHGAMWVAEGKVVALGTLEEVRAQCPANTAEVALPGAIVIPGFHDAHIHTGNLAREIEAPDLRGCVTLDEALERLRAYAAQRTGTNWVLGGRWDRNAWEGRTEPTRHHLDDIFGDRPVSLPSIDGHSAWANTAALNAAGITEHTPDPVGGRITREPGTQVPAGTVFETAEDPLRVLSEASIVPRLHELLAQAHYELLAMGITHVTNYEGADVRDAYARLHADGRLQLRAHIGIAMDDLDDAIARGVRTGDGDDLLTVGPVKLFSDGALGSRTAHVHEDFTGDPGNHGIEVIPFAELALLVEKAVGAGIAVATHAIGDQANSLVLDVYSRVYAQTQRAGLINRIEHSQHLQWADVPRFAKLNVVASMQPIHCTSDYPLSVELLGERDIAHYPWRSLRDAGATVAFGSDAPVEPADPIYGVHAAVTRTRRDGEPRGGREPEQRVSVAEALRGFTREPARAAGLGDQFGRLAPGCHADFIALDQDPFTIDPALIWQIKVAATAVAGEIVFTR